MTQDQLKIIHLLEVKKEKWIYQGLLVEVLISLPKNDEKTFIRAFDLI